MDHPHQEIRQALRETAAQACNTIQKILKEGAITELPRQKTVQALLVGIPWYHEIVSADQEDIEIIFDRLKGQEPLWATLSRESLKVKNPHVLGLIDSAVAAHKSAVFCLAGVQRLHQCDLTAEAEARDEAEKMAQLAEAGIAMPSPEGVSAAITMLSGVPAMVAPAPDTPPMAETLASLAGDPDMRVALAGAEGPAPGSGLTLHQCQRCGEKYERREDDLTPLTCAAGEPACNGILAQIPWPAPGEPIV